MTTNSHAYQPLVEAHLTGELTHNSRLINQQAVRELIAKNPYWSLQLDADLNVSSDEDKLMAIIVESFGISIAQFNARDNSEINPERTAGQLKLGLERVLKAAGAGQTIALATGHPGSMLETYRWIGELITQAGGKVWELPPHTPASHGHYLDQIGGVVTLSDEGSLMHSHDNDGIGMWYSQLGAQLVVADHGYAAAAVNAGIPTIAFYDTDDPALPLAAHAGADLTAIPMNDNQTNGLTAAAVQAFWSATRER